jgi:hypothetical protein
MILIEPLTKILVNRCTVTGEKVKERVFGGFCVCGGIMYQKSWFKLDNDVIIVSECDKCWRNEAMLFNGKALALREEIKVVDRTSFRKFLKESLTTAEYEALESKLRNGKYNYNAFSRAKKKLEEMGLSVEEIVGFI